MIEGTLKAVCKCRDKECSTNKELWVEGVDPFTGEVKIEKFELSDCMHDKRKRSMTIEREVNLEC